MHADLRTVGNHARQLLAEDERRQVVEGSVEGTVVLEQHDDVRPWRPITVAAAVDLTGEKVDDPLLAIALASRDEGSALRNLEQRRQRLHAEVDGIHVQLILCHRPHQ